MEHFVDHPLDACDNQLHHSNAISMDNMDQNASVTWWLKFLKKKPYCPSNLAGPAHPSLTAQQHINIPHSASHRSHMVWFGKSPPVWMGFLPKPFCPHR